MSEAAQVVQVEDVALNVPKRTLVTGVTFGVAEGMTLGLIGPSGSGKTTLLKCLAGILVPGDGIINVAGRALSSQSARNRARIRLQSIGMVFQFGDLLPELSVLGNVALPLQLAGMRRRDAERAARTALGSVDMESFADAQTDALSGGEMQRIGIARAIVANPRLILADEPTGALDEQNSIKITELLIRKASEIPSALIVATHDPLVYDRMDSIMDLREFAPTASKVNA